MIIVSKDLGRACHLQMEFSLDAAQEEPKCREPSGFQAWHLEIRAFENGACDAGVQLEPL